ncbi:ParB/RepB/Spo0J family partition protein [Marivivens donghaensis]|uniref:ParB/RepB/Spo0J family partition protein n=1 Tax=Marivivens donghaensis TaxID=1699413 RepID=A0ABX0VV14_9RHOB|nr:ParB/RepB/Spo0J family partition protein [Marivivens donghaensis]NIY71448.1 ParB/RepB/Spo0J family partition protein [Marivivens donghaensis]
MADKPNRNRGLGRGLSALMADVNAPVERAPAAADSAPRRPDMMVAIERVEPNPDQPRRSFADEALQELASSVKEKGVIQPLIVRTSPRDASKFEIVAGERRWRASQIAQLHELPVIVREFSDTEVLEVAIIENIQRADLNAIDEAAGYKQLMDRFGHTQEQLSQALGKSRSHIANLLRLLNLPRDVQTYVIEGQLSAGHARTLVGNEQAAEIAQKIIQQGLSVRDAEKLTKADPAKQKATQNNRVRAAAKDPDTAQIEQELSSQIGMKVSIDHDANGEGGRISIRYESLDQLDDVMRILSSS